MTWKAPSRGSGTGLIGKLTQANIDEVAPVDDEIVAVRDDGPTTGPLRQRLAQSTRLRVREATDLADLAGLTATGRTRAVVLCRSHLSLVDLHQAVTAVRRDCPDVAIVVLDDRGGAGREAVATHAGADALVGLSDDWKTIGEFVLDAADRRAEDRAVGDIIEVTGVDTFAGRCEEAWPLALLVLQADNLAAVTARYAGGDADSLMLALAVRLRPVLRPSDMMVRSPDNCLLIARRDADELATAALAEAGVIKPWPLTVQVGNQHISVSGLCRVDEPALNALDDKTFLKLRKASALVVAHGQLMSMNQVSVLSRLAFIQQQMVQSSQVSA